MKKLTAVIEQEEDIHTPHCPEIGTVSQGHISKEADSNLKEATASYLEEVPTKTATQTITFEVANIVKT